ncbi:hypothetical protein CSW57_22825 [Williamsia muralis]|uniref:Uncharacterized protein n=1 Tax=Williamsia marianensis TaxID=85044 RepID=A0A2G3PG00_WILMA|nr:hypothetical protein CSW57_22825 [Williamsia marianensis]
MARYRAETRVRVKAHEVQGGQPVSIYWAKNSLGLSVREAVVVGTGLLGAAAQTDPASVIDALTELTDTITRQMHT